MPESNREVDIEITPEMIAAGVSELRSFNFGMDEREIVRAIYLMMEIERTESAKERSVDN